MNCSPLTASTAGTESTANSTSVVSTSTSTANSGVASRRPATRVHSFWPSYSLVEGTTRRTSRRNGLCSGSMSPSSSDRSSFHAV